MSPSPLAPKLLALLAAMALLTGCSGAALGHGAEQPPSDGSGMAPTAEASSPFQEGHHYAATAKKAVIAVHEAPNGPVVDTYDNPQPSGAPLTFLVKGHSESWLEVYLPTRPNGSSGWILGGAVEVNEVPYRLEVSTADNKMALYESGQLVKTFAVATGTGGTPTPHGTFYLTELMAPSNPGYGPYAYGLSAFSEVLTEFVGGPGQIGLHGTDDASSIGQSASHGCIRLSNEDITELAEMLPLGTPIEIS